MAWLLIIWIALICLWGIGERWTVGDTVKGLRKRRRSDPDADAEPPFDWAKR